MDKLLDKFIELSEKQIELNIKLLKAEMEIKELKATTMPIKEIKDCLENIGNSVYIKDNKKEEIFNKFFGDNNE